VNADPDLATKINADPSGSGSETLASWVCFLFLLVQLKFISCVFVTKKYFFYYNVPGDMNDKCSLIRFCPVAGYESILGLANEDGSLAFQDTSKVIIYTTIHCFIQSLDIFADFWSFSRGRQCCGSGSAWICISLESWIWICIKVKSRIWIFIKVESWIRVRIKAKKQESGSASE
jgi:hypothetical protein